MIYFYVLDLKYLHLKIFLSEISGAHCSGIF